MIQWTYEKDENIVTVAMIEYDGWFGTDDYVVTDSDHLEITKAIAPEFMNGEFESGEDANTGCEILDKMLEDWDGLH